MGRVFGLILSLLGGIAFGLGAFSLLTPPDAGWLSVEGAQTAAVAVLPCLALWFASWLAFALDAIQRDIYALRQETARVDGTLSRFIAQVTTAQPRKAPISPSRL